MGDTETEKTRKNPIPWICGLGAVWLSVGVARGCEDPRILEWFPGWGEKGKLRGIFVTELRHFQHFNRRHQRMSHKLQILQEFYLHIPSVVDCPTFSTIYDVLHLYFWKLLFTIYYFHFLFFVIYWKKVYCLIIFRLHHVLDGRPRLEGGTLRGSDAEG